MKNFYGVLVNTLIANITTSYLWFALTFWLYLETRSVLATGLVGGGYMLLVALCSILFGTIVDHNKKKKVMLASSLFTLGCFAIGGALYALAPAHSLTTLTHPLLWLFAAIILAGAVVENMRNIALSTTVTLLVPKEIRDKANGLVGSVQGVGFIITSALSGLSIGILGMGWTLFVAIVLTGIALAHLVTVQIPEKGIAHDPELEKTKIDLRGSIAAIRVVPGLFALIFFSTFNNLIGGVYMALMDPYGLTLVDVKAWGMAFAFAGTGFILGGLIVAKKGLGKNPIRTLLMTVLLMGVVGALFAIREWWPLYVAGIWVYMLLVPAAEAAEQTIIQRVVPYARQGRVFGFAQALESAAMPITAFAIAPIAEFGIIPFMNSDRGKELFGWLVGSGQARGIALTFLFAGLIMILVALLAFSSKSYKTLSAYYKTS